MINDILYILGFQRGTEAGKSDVILDGEISCSDDGSGNITITQGE